MLNPGPVGMDRITAHTNDIAPWLAVFLGLIFILPRIAYGFVQIMAWFRLRRGR